ncbi:MAG: DUF1329 domain-containing protein [Pseudomonadota bacterium]|mgnify:CR=1 FL=1
MNKYLLACALLIHTHVSYGGVSADEAARLGRDLTPIGAERAGNVEGSIPEWTPLRPYGSPPGKYTLDPKMAEEKPLFTITAANAAQYANRLTAGHRKLLQTYPTYRMQVYPSRRDVSWPDAIVDATRVNATRCGRDGDETLDNCRLGFPFPIPQAGAEPIWNHKLKWRGEALTRYNNQLIVQSDGRYQLTKLVEDVDYPYASIVNPVPLTRTSAEFSRYLSQTLAPPRLAGTFLLFVDRVAAGSQGRAGWTYSPSLRRVRRSSNLCCDNPYEGTDGHQFYDQIDMFNGTLSRFNWQLLGKRELYISYHANRIANPKIKYADMVRPGHFNPELPRYELHRVWVVEGTVKPSVSHTFKRRVLYLDEDTWTIVAVDAYDHRDGLYQFQEGHLLVAARMLAGFTSPELIYHFSSGRYFVTGVANEDKPPNTDPKFPADHFTPEALRRRASVGAGE